MARLKKGNLKKPWKAECKVDYQTYFLGYWPTKAEAVAEERLFREHMTGSPDPGHTDCVCPSHRKAS